MRIPAIPGLQRWLGLWTLAALLGSASCARDIPRGAGPAASSGRTGVLLQWVVQLRTGDSRGAVAGPLTPAELESTRGIVHAVVRAAAADVQALALIDRGASESIPPELSVRLREVDRWLERSGDSILETRGGPLPPGPWGGSTHRGRTVFLHYLADRPGAIRFNASIGSIQTAYLFATGEAIDVLRSGDRYTIEIAAYHLDPLDTIVVLELGPDGPP